MPSYEPNPSVVFGGVTQYSGNNLSNINITMGRTNIMDQPQPSYATVNLWTSSDAPLDAITLSQSIQIYIDKGTSGTQQIFEGIVSDIDIKKDVTISKDEFRKGIKELDKASIKRKSVGLGSNPFYNNNNLGIEWNSREKATPTAPFIKIYCKELQSVMKDAKLLKDEEQPFFETYVGHQNLKDIVRIETTIKNLKSARRYGIENLSLLEVMKLTSEQLNKIIVTALNLNLERRTPVVNKIKNLDKLTPNELLIYIHIDNMLRNQNNDIEMAIEYTLNYFEDKVAKSRMKAKLLDVYSQHIERQTYVVKSKKINEFFTNIGWS